MDISESFVRSSSLKRIEQFDQTRLVRITYGTFPIWLDPFGMLDPQVVVNLLPEFGVSVDLVRHRLGERFKCAAERFLQSLAGIVDLRWRRGAHANNSKRPHAPARGVCDDGPTRSLFGAGVVATRPAVRLA